MSMYVETAAPRSRRWMLVGWLTVFLVGTDLFVVSPFLTTIGRDLASPQASLTWIVSIFSATYAVACPLQGRLAERIGSARVLLAGVAMLAIGNLCTAWAHDLPSLLASRALAGLGAASTSPTLYALASEHAPPQRRASDLALINSGLLMSLVLGAPLGLMMGSFSDWRLVFELLAVAFAALLPVNCRVWRPAAAPARPASVRPPGTLAAEPLAAAWPCLAAMVCWSASVYALYTLLGAALAADYRLEAVGVATCLGVFGAGAALGSVCGGRLADRVGPARMATGCFVAMIVWLTALLAVYPSRAIAWLAVLLFLFALSAYGFFPALQACAVQRFAARRPTVLGLISSSLYVGLTLGSAAGGLLFRRLGMPGVVLFGLGASLAGMALARGLDAPGNVRPAAST
ncbi:MAG: MFS transporter [Xenophilus sp.]